ncbi:uncharacterized protein LOC108146020 isoform X1 [Drosophila elegans]|uniref:uncharacterized protein LOC108146020 isoform X1 n=1 Tax=Drosophila elegans TaxID=30023 RepID=UPI0007E8247C|nr:uncharacterized protein LOC108146020 isoform X1 [Drosophila elegans]
MSDAAYSGFYGGNQVSHQLHLLPLSHPHSHLPLQHPHPHQDLSLSTPVHALEHDSNFGGFFDDELGGIGNASTAPTSATSVWLPDGETPGQESQPNPAIPFVQIHTTDLQQQPEKSYRNAFRRRTAEIKSEAELIKSELAAEAAAKERLNATPTPPTRNSSCASADPLEGKEMAMVQDGPPLILRCSNCPFLSLSQARLQQHLHLGNCYGNMEQQRRQCPGCSNILYSSDALSWHLSLDHQMEDNEVLTLLKDGKPNEVHSKKQAQIVVPNRPKSRIFIKSVDCLREPLPDFSPLMPDSGSTGNILDLLEGVAVGASPSEQTMPTAPAAANAPAPPPKPSQKISIKSVDVLREPALLPFDFQLQSHPLITDIVGLEPPEKPRQPKIYIRNVDILKEPMVLPSALPGMGFNGGIPLAVDSGQVGLPLGDGDVFQADALLTPTTCPLPGFEPSLAPLAQMCSSEAFPFDSVLNGNGGGAVSSLDNTRFSALDLDFGVDFVSDENTPPPPLNNDSLTTMAEPQTVQLEHYLPPPVAPITTKQKIFIKNVDILKAPQRGTLHLRTVDELNLMNRTEVEHLIVPNLEPMAMTMMELPPVEQPPLELDTQLNTQAPPSLGEFQPSISGSWPSEGGYDLAEDLECWPWMEEAVPESGLGLPTPSEAGGEASPLEDLMVKDFSQLYEPPPTEEAPDAGVAGEESGGGVGGGEGAVPPPLGPVTSSGGTATVAQSTPLCSLPVPPLVPLEAEKPARIYVANNLLPTAHVVEPPQLGGGTSVRGRPYGAKHSGGTTGSKRKPPQGPNQQPEGGKCLVEGCMFRFKSPATLEYHGRCHNGASSSSNQPMICPECRSSNFSNWNCLHTHLWRTHQIDMELYSCQLCSFKTPIYSRLVNTHAKIHSEERNYKCEQCGKGFKNTKQLKNHRRLHRTQGLGMGKPTEVEASAVVMHRCEDCGAAFKQRKSLREHLCKERNEQLECPECQRVFGSKSSLRLHLRSHQEQKRFRCDACDHEASDHNAFRRHLATHKELRRYSCPHCDFRAIQSTAFRIHLQKRHPEQELSSIIYKCDQCSFTSINQGLLQVHQAKHEVPSPNQSQIKVESSVVLAHSSTKVAKEVVLAQANVLQAS